MIFQRPYILKPSGGAYPRLPQQLAPSALLIAPPPPINLTLLRHWVKRYANRVQMRPGIESEIKPMFIFSWFTTPRNRETTPSSDVLVLHITLIKVWTIPATTFSQRCHSNILSGEGSRIVTFFLVNGTLKHEFSPVKHSSLRTGHGNKAYWRQLSFLARSVFNKRRLRKVLCRV